MQTQRQTRKSISGVAARARGHASSTSSSGQFVSLEQSGSLVMVSPQQKWAPWVPAVLECSSLLSNTLFLLLNVHQEEVFSFIKNSSYEKVNIISLQKN